ncbi:hypothetical protein WAQ86_004772 [Salmonella enterica]
MTKKDAQMTPLEFEIAREKLQHSGISAETFDIAREVLVDGLPQVRVAKEHGLTRQRINSMVKRVTLAFSDIPQDWERVEIWLPPELAQKVRDMAQSARDKLNVEDV